MGLLPLPDVTGPASQLAVPSSWSEVDEAAPGVLWGPGSQGHSQQGGAPGLRLHLAESSEACCSWEKRPLQPHPASHPQGNTHLAPTPSLPWHWRVSPAAPGGPCASCPGSPGPSSWCPRTSLLLWGYGPSPPREHSPHPLPPDHCCRLLALSTSSPQQTPRTPIHAPSSHLSWATHLLMPAPLTPP